MLKPQLQQSQAGNCKPDEISVNLVNSCTRSSFMISNWGVDTGLLEEVRLSPSTRLEHICFETEESWSPSVAWCLQHNFQGISTSVSKIEQGHASWNSVQKSGRTDKAQSIFPPCSNDPLASREKQSRGKDGQMKLSHRVKKPLCPTGRWGAQSLEEKRRTSLQFLLLEPAMVITQSVGQNCTAQIMV